MSALDWAVWIALLLVGYAYAGYPLLLRLVSRGAAHRPAPAAPAELAGDWPAVTVVVAAYDEAARIGARLDNLLASHYPADRLRVIVVSDGSTDGTVAAVRAREDPRVTVLEGAGRRGKAACLNDGLAACGTDFVVMTDVRQPLEPDAIARLVGALRADPRLGAVSGELVFRDDAPTAFSRGVDFYWRYEKRIRQLESGWRSVVGVTGAIYALRRELWQPLPAGTILDDVLVPMRIAMAGHRVAFEPAARAWDTPSRDAATERRRKVRTLAGNWQLLALEPRLMSPAANPIALEYWSHKILRLIAPFLLALAFAGCGALAARSPLYASLFLAQLAFYGLALAGAAVRALQPLALVRVPLAFVQLNSFAVLGLLEFLRNRDAHLWR
jgi:cellulose synthase/poly-beta-1,6-N-acetylglucosamine synthase-like glycosyltransferase